MPAYSPTYQDFLRAWDLNHAEDDSGYRPAADLTEEQFNALTPYQQHESVRGNNSAPGTYTIGQDDPLYQQFYSQFGQNDAVANSGFELNNQAQTGLALGYDTGRNGVAGPSYGRLDWNQLAIDPSRILWLDPEGTEGRRYLYERSNAIGNNVESEQRRQSHQFLGDDAGLIMAAIFSGGVAGAGYLGGAEAGAGMLAESVAPVVTEGMMAAPEIYAGAAGAAGAGAEAGGGMLAESVAPTVTEEMVASPYFSPDVPIDPMLEESVAPQVTEQMVSSPYDRPWWRDLGQLGRDLLGGPGGTGAGSIIGALMGQGGGKIGGHAVDNDPYGLIASGYGPWTGLLDKPKDKVVEALARRSRTMGI